MAKKDRLPPCPHCKAVFSVPLRWCPSCEDHVGEMSWFGGNDTCDGCAGGENAEYLERRKGRAERVAKAMAELPPVSTEGPILQALVRWFNSPDYSKRFDP